MNEKIVPAPAPASRKRVVETAPLRSIGAIFNLRLRARARSHNHVLETATLRSIGATRNLRLRLSARTRARLVEKGL